MSASWHIDVGDSLDVLASWPDCCVDSVCTDPPYGLSFMSKDWDGELPDVKLWRQVLRVMKPGAHLAAFGAPRTYHRLACHIEDAGFEIRDCIQWLYGSGFPKSLDVAKQDGCEEWDGWGTALKPANEPIVLARKPLDGTVARNVQTYGTGGLNIDGCRIGTSDNLNGGAYAQDRVVDPTSYGLGSTGRQYQQPSGRWPANVVLDEEAARLLDEQSGVSVSRAGTPGASAAPGEGWGMTRTGAEYDDVGGASRFFYVAKASRAEREAGLDAFEVKDATEAVGREPGSAGTRNPRAGAGRSGGRRNTHPTVKPVALMRWLVRLITPPGGLVLDPFTGSGTTGIAAVAAVVEGFRFHGIEFDPHYAEIARARAAYWEAHPDGLEPEPEESEADRRQMALFGGDAA